MIVGVIVFLHKHFIQVTKCLTGGSSNNKQLNALLDPVVWSHSFPVLRAGDVHETIMKSALHASIKHLKELGSNCWLHTP